MVGNEKRIKDNEGIKAETFELLKKQRSRLVLGILAGSSIEFYDYLLTATIAALIWPLIFVPPGSGLWGYVLSMGLFVAGQATRPIGALIWGHIGDRIGRRNTLIYELVVMSIAMLGIALTPDYSTLGVTSIFLLLSFRLLQGLSMGGEYGTAASWLVEYSAKLEPNKRVFYGSWIPTAIYLGQLSAVLGLLGISIIFPGYQLYTLGWRILYIIGSFAALIGIFIRLRLFESPLFIEIVHKRELESYPSIKVFKGYWKYLFFLALISFSLVSFYYTSQSFALAYMKVLGFDYTTVVEVNAIALVIAIIVNYFAALAGDKIGRKLLVILGLASGIILTYPYMISIASLNIVFATISHILYYAIAWAIPYAVLQTFIAEHFPTNMRVSGTNIAYQTGNSIGGSLATFLGTYIVALVGNPKIAWLYVGALGISLAIPGLLVVFLLKDTKDKHIK